MVPLVELGKLAGVETPIMRSVVELCGLLLGQNYFETGQTLAKMGLEGKSIREIGALMQE